MAVPIRYEAQPAVPAGCFGSFESMERTMKIAEGLAASNIIPDQFKGKAGDVLIALDMAMRLDMNPLAVMQNIYLVHGKPAWSGTFCAALITVSGRYVSFRYEEEDTGEEIKALGRKNRRCRVAAVTPDGETEFGAWIDLNMAVTEGWTSKAGSKWKTMADQMLRYRAATFFVRSNCPDALMGLREAQEEEDIYNSNQKAVRVKAETPQGALAEVPRETVEAEVIEEGMVAKAEAPIVESESALAVKDYLNAIAISSTENDLDYVGKKISEDGRLDKYQKNVLRSAFKERRGELQQSRQQDGSAPWEEN